MEEELLLREVDILPVSGDIKPCLKHWAGTVACARVANLGQFDPLIDAVGVYRADRTTNQRMGLTGAEGVP